MKTQLIKRYGGTIGIWFYKFPGSIDIEIQANELYRQNNRGAEDPKDAQIPWRVFVSD
jgi:hypothetical protein